MTFELQIAAALVLDQLFGDPAWLPHPVRLIGWCCRCFEAIARRLLASARLAGGLTVLAVLAATVAATGLLLQMAALVSPVAADCAAVLILYSSVAARDLIVHSRRVYRHLQSGPDLDAARGAVAMIVGRDTAELDRAGISRACVETVAENMVDGVTAPLFFAVVCSLLPSSFGFGAIENAALGAMCYKAVNTMDSMFGYKNERYLEFGWSAAKLDDVANFLPARLSGFMVILAAVILRLDGKGAATIFFRDRLQHSSPNSAHTEAAVAGALGIQLGGPSRYFGTVYRKPTIGDKRRDIEAADILVAGKIMQTGTLLFVVLLILLRRALLEG